MYGAKTVAHSLALFELLLKLFRHFCKLRCARFAQQFVSAMKFVMEDEPRIEGFPPLPRTQRILIYFYNPDRPSGESAFS